MALDATLGVWNRWNEGELTVKVLLVPNYGRSDALQGAHNLSGWLEAEGHEAVLAPDKKRHEE